nr:hypothetical protein [Tanacetum cinerariifolium]
MNKMVRNQLEVATMQVNVQFLQQLQPKWSRFKTIVKQTIDLDKESYHKLFDILKQYKKEVNEIHAEKIAKNANLLALVATTQQNKNVDTTPRYVNENQTVQFRNQRTVTVAGARLMVVVQIRVVDLENREVVVRYLVVEIDWRGPMANCLSLIRRGYLVTHVVEEVLEWRKFLRFLFYWNDKIKFRWRCNVISVRDLLSDDNEVDGSGSNSGSGFGKPGGSREILGGGDRLEGPDGQLSIIDT